LAIFFFTEEINFKFGYKSKYKKWINNVAVKENRTIGNINIIFCNDAKILEINKKYLNHNYFTDVITFDNCIGNKLNGDIFISIDTVKRNAEIYNCLFNNELNRVIVHGILHLIGYSDHSYDDKEVMRNLENIYLDILSFN
jgi:rRNA maturation RNase YbeY